jgi:DNA-binding CsgD family transcriptional regulator
MRIFDVLSGHLARALQIFARLSTRTMLSKAGASLISDKDAGIILMDAEGYVADANDAAIALDGNGFSIVGRRLAASNRADQAALDRHLTRVLAGRGTPEGMEPVALSRQGHRKPLVLQAVAIKASAPAQFGSLCLPGGAFVAVIDPETAPRRAGFETFLPLGLSPAEARVASILGCGKSPEMTAEELQLSTGTVRNHIKSIYAKLDLSRQSELVALAIRLASISSRQ